MYSCKKDFICTRLDAREWFVPASLLLRVCWTLAETGERQQVFFFMVGGVVNKLRRNIIIITNARYTTAVYS